MAVVSGCSRLVLPARFALISSVGGKIALPWQNDDKFRELPRFSHNINSAAVLLHDDVVRHRETKAGSFTGWLGREERVDIFSCTPAGIPAPLSRLRISTVLPRLFVVA